ncbi:hypothetical protein BKH46_02485 [Helicobacter sp. 12S02634-8]|uniref:hypothetical protein n=1 Tax=Helicobacter sp. 12S02634-8 TaxID=1476199 RepID=UPI000BA7B8AD|nr:hypothetical protein [Helicobacter sp. 12S02634-8]PAF47723.1 hypothetical protein BKH46_02485 [Helicobacter sp. 12S02634-8]
MKPQAFSELRNLLKSLPALSDTDREERIKRAKSDFRFFVKTYFSHYIQEPETSLFRNFVYDNINGLLQEHKLLLFKAYRGAAKTTILSRLLSLWLLLTHQKSYALIISSTLDIAKESIETLKVECEDNANLIADFALSAGVVWSAEEFILKVAESSVKVKAFGAAKKIRGTNFLGKRPDWIVCDDIENDENIQSKAQRDKLHSWFLKAVLKLPARTQSYNILIVGTTLHHDSLLARLEERSDVESFNFPLVLDFGTQIEGLSKQSLLANEERGEKPYQAMIIDDESLDKRGVLLEFLEDKDSFFSEYQNTPLSKENAPLSRYRTFEALPEKIDAIYMGIDPSLGRARGDLFGICSLFYSKAHQKYYARATGYQVNPEVMIGIILETYLKNLTISPFVTLGIEVVAYQQFFKQILMKTARERGLGLIPVIELKNTQNKELRLDTLAPLLSEEALMIDSSCHELILELDTYPKSKYDDLLDSLEFAIRIARGGARLDYSLALKAMGRSGARFQGLKQRL